MSKYFAGGHLRFLEGEWRDDNGDVVEITPVVHGKWVSIPGPVLTFRCGNIDCARAIPFGCLPQELKYCPFCGARMDGGK